MLTDVETCDMTRIIMELSYLIVNQNFAKIQEKMFYNKRSMGR